MDANTKSRQHFNNARMRSFFKSIYSKLKKEDDCLPAFPAGDKRHHQG